MPPLARRSVATLASFDKCWGCAVVHRQGLAARATLSVRVKMKYVSRAIVGALLMAASTHSASAQVPALTNADITRLVAMHVSDQTVIAVIHEATTTHFDLSAQATSELAGLSTAIVAAMRQPSTPKPLVFRSSSVFAPVSGPV